MPLDYVELLKVNLTEEEIMEVIALSRKDTSVALLPYIEFILEIESDERKLSVLEKMEIDASMSMEEIVDRVLTAFDWRWPYEEMWYA